jgi:hypothetical protein
MFGDLSGFACRLTTMWICPVFFPGNFHYFETVIIIYCKNMLLKC